MMTIQVFPHVQERWTYANKCFEDGGKMQRINNVLVTIFQNKGDMTRRERIRNGYVRGS